MTRQKKLRLSGIITAPLCKGSSAEGGEGLFFYNSPTAARFPNPSRRRLQACFAHSQIPPTAARFPNPSWRRLQACFAYLQIPLHKGAVIIPDNRSFFCLLFFSKKSMVIDLSAVRLYRQHWLPRLCGAGRRSRRTRCRFRA